MVSLCACEVVGLGGDVGTRHAPELNNIMRDLILRVWKAELKEQRKIIIGCFGPNEMGQHMTLQTFSFRRLSGDVRSTDDRYLGSYILDT